MSFFLFHWKRFYCSLNMLPYPCFVFLAFHGFLFNVLDRCVFEMYYCVWQVIFVDADQVVRADMGELYDMDIKGRPLAYTPFCDNNKDMDGYRFWRQVCSINSFSTFPPFLSFYFFWLSVLTTIKFLSNHL